MLGNFEKEIVDLCEKHKDQLTLTLKELILSMGSSYNSVVESISYMASSFTQVSKKALLEIIDLHIDDNVRSQAVVSLTMVNRNHDVDLQQIRRLYEKESDVWIKNYLRMIICDNECKNAWVDYNVSFLNGVCS